MSENTMTKLNDLPYEILLRIAKGLKKIKDFRSFRGVSKSLRAVRNEDYFEGLPLRQGIPYLLLPVRNEFDSYTNDSDDYENDDIREFFKDDIREVYSLIEGESVVASVEVPGFKTLKCLESLGWLLVVEKDGSMSLIDPFSGIEIPLPHKNTFPESDSLEMDAHEFVRKMVLSSRPSETNSNFILMIIAGRRRHLAVWRLGHKAWTMVEDQGERHYIDVAYGGGEQFYAITNPGIVWVFNLARNGGNHGKGPMILNSERNLPVHVYGNVYILKTANDSLLIITRTVYGMCYATTKKFKVYEVDIKTGTWKEIHSLGSLAIFLGHNSSIAVDTSGYPPVVIKANCIYFTDDNRIQCHGEVKFESGTDSGVYNMETRDIKPIHPGEVLLSTVSSSLWITPCF